MRRILFLSLVSILAAGFLFAQGSPELGQLGGDIVDAILREHPQWVAPALKIVSFLAILSEIMALIPNKYLPANGTIDLAIKSVQAIAKHIKNAYTTPAP
jgi:NADH:ubiquinone oxidoreductase subunit 6 (subunit J)